MAVSFMVSAECPQDDVSEFMNALASWRRERGLRLAVAVLGGISEAEFQVHFGDIDFPIKYMPVEDVHFMDDGG